MFEGDKVYLIPECNIIILTDFFFFVIIALRQHFCQSFLRIRLQRYELDTENGTGTGMGVPSSSGISTHARVSW